MEVALAYDRRTSLETGLGATALDFAANRLRRPVSFRGRVLEPLLLRQLLLTLHASLRSDLRYGEEEQLARVLDPVVTIHDDQLFFEAFSGDQSCYTRLSAPLSAFDIQGEVRYGTTNVDFSGALAEALPRMRDSRRTELRVGAGGVGMATEVGASTLDAFERKVEVSERWLKGFLQVQGALGMPGYTFAVHPTDLLSVIAYFQEHVPPSTPHGLRYEFARGVPITAILEPWERRFTLRDTAYTGYPRTVRVWGRKRLELLRGVLPYADRATITVLGRGLPHVYSCRCGPFTFLLALSGWVKQDWAADAAFDLLAPRGAGGDNAQSASRVHAYLGEHLAAPAAQIAADTGLAPREVELALFALCRAGRAMVDPTTRQYRLRELFAQPLDVGALFTPDPRMPQAERLLAEGRVTLGTITPPEDSEDGRNETRAEATVREAVAGGEASYAVRISVDDSGRLRFGRCECPFFQRHIMSRGPCVHIMAARMALDAALPAVAPERGGAGEPMTGDFPAEVRG
jgi:hypothetical protein